MFMVIQRKIIIFDQKHFNQIQICKFAEDSRTLNFNSFFLKQSHNNHIRTNIVQNILRWCTKIHFILKIAERPNTLTPVFWPQNWVTMTLKKIVNLYFGELAMIFTKNVYKNQTILRILTFVSKIRPSSPIIKNLHWTWTST